jgi:hypothetical protein
MELSEILTKYAVPDPKIVGKLPKGGQQLDFVGHADTQKALSEIDPTWLMEPVAFDSDGLPAYRVENGMAHMACWMTVLGVRRLGIGSVMHNKPDLLKELLSDAIRNCAMRHNVYLSLWTKSEWDDVDNHKPAPTNKPAAKPMPTPVAPSQNISTELLSPKQREDFEKACKDGGFSTIMVAQRAGLKWDNSVKVSDLPALRAAWHDFKNEKAETE